MLTPRQQVFATLAFLGSQIVALQCELRQEQMGHAMILEDLFASEDYQEHLKHQIRALKDKAEREQVVGANLNGALPPGTSLQLPPPRAEDGDQDGEQWKARP